jgi:hypothetical protein
VRARGHRKSKAVAGGQGRTNEHPDFRDNQRVVRDAGMIRSRIEAAGYRDYFRDHINTLYVRNDVLENAKPEIDAAKLA